MRIRVSKDFYVNSNTLIRLEWRRYYPVLVVHEKFERILKWINRIITLVGILTSILTISPWYYSLGLSLLIFLVGLFFERTVLEYTTIVFQPPPDFKIDYHQWKTNGFRLPQVKSNNDLACFGLAFLDKEYAIKFFKYLRSWINSESNDDIENNLVVSLVIELNEEYTTYIYANLGRKKLDRMFRFLGDLNRLTKYGKRQQQFITQMFYWNTLSFKDESYIKKFLDFQKPNDPFLFLPTVIQPFEQPPEFLLDYAIKKYGFLLRKREELNKSDIEFHFKPENKKKEIITPNSVNVKNQTFRDIEKVLSTCEDVGFMPNEGTHAGIINLCFSDPHLPYIAYIKLIENKGDGETVIKIKENVNDLEMTIDIAGHDKDLVLKNCKYNKHLLDKFREVNGGGPEVVLLIGYTPAQDNKIVLQKDHLPLVLKWELI